MIANIIRNAKKTVTGGDPYYSAVSLLLPMDGTSGSTTFADSSLNALTVTAVGNTQISTTQSKYGGASGYFDGSGDYLDMSGTGVATAFGTRDFTIEFWYYPLSVSVQQNLVDKIGSASNAIYMSSAGVLNYYVAGDRITGATLSANTWYHIALVRYSGVTKLYVNGVQSGASYTDTNNYALNTGSPRIGAAFNNTVSVNGYIDDFRISLFARYVSNFTPPASALPTTASSTPADPYYGYTSLLLNMDGTNASTNFVDSGPNALTITPTGTTISTSQAKYGASGYFNGTSAYLTAASSAITLGTSDFTIEFWIYPLDVRTFSLYDSRTNETNPNGNGFVIGTSASQAWVVYQAANRIVGPTVVANQWTHVAVTRSGSSVKMWINGVQVGSTWTTTGSFSDGATLIGTDYPKNARFVYGYIDDLRVTKYARYTSAFAPPAQAHPNIYNPYTTLPVSGAALWLAGDDSSTLYTDAGTSAVTKSGDLVYQWTDKSGNSRNAIQATSGNRPTWVAPASARNNLGAVAFNGTSQFLNLASDPIGTNDYTIEFWMKQEATTASYWVILDSRVSGNAIGYPVILYNNSSTALSFYNNGWLLSATVSVSTWTHVAITRSSGTIRMFVNGSIASSGTDTSSYNTFRQLGKAFDPYYFKGQIQNLIIYNGQALYTANFTPWMS